MDLRNYSLITTNLFLKLICLVFCIGAAHNTEEGIMVRTLENIFATQKYTFSDFEYTHVQPYASEELMKDLSHFGIIGVIP